MEWSRAVNGGELAAIYRLSLRNYRLKFKTSGKLPIVLEESMIYASN